MKLPFDRKEWNFEELTHRKSRDGKRLDRNTKKFIDWIINLLKTTAPRLPEHGEKYHCQGVRLHPENNEYLSNYIYPMDWLNYSPMDDESVGLDEVVIDHWFDGRSIK